MADGIELAKAYVQIIPSADGISGSISNVVSPEASSAGDVAGSILGENLVSKLKGVLVAGGIATAIKGVINSVNEVASAGDNIDKMSQKMGIASDQFQALSFMGEHCAISMGTFQKANVTIQKSGFNGTLVDFLDKLQGIEDVSQRTAYAQEILGEKTANEMAAFINGNDTMTDYYNQLKDLGGMMSDDSVKAAATYEDSLTNMNIAMDSIKTRIMSELLPGFSQVMDGAAMLFSGDGQGFKVIYDGISGMFSMVYEKGKELLHNFITGIWDKLPDLISTNGDVFNNLLDNILDKLPEFIVKGGELVASLIKGIASNIPNIVASVVSLLVKVIGTIISHLPQMIESGIKMVSSLIKGIVQSIPDIVSTIPKIYDAIKKQFDGIIKKAKTWGVDMIKGFISGITGMIGDVVGAVKGVASKITSFLHFSRPDEGPLRDYETWMPDMMSGLAKGIEKNKHLVTDALGGLSSDMVLSSNLNGDFALSSNDNSMIAQMVELLEEIKDKDNNYTFKVNGKTMAYALVDDIDNALAYKSRKLGGNV